MDQMMHFQKLLENIEAEGHSVNQLVKVKLNGEKELTSIKIDPSCIDPNDVEGLEDLIMDAMKKAHAILDEKLKGLSPFAG